MCARRHASSPSDLVLSVHASSCSTRCLSTLKSPTQRSSFATIEQPGHLQSPYRRAQARETLQQALASATPPKRRAPQQVGGVAGISGGVVRLSWLCFATMAFSVNMNVASFERSEAVCAHTLPAQ